MSAIDLLPSSPKSVCLKWLLRFPTFLNVARPSYLRPPTAGLLFRRARYMSRRVSWRGGVSAVLLVCALVFTMLPGAAAQETTGGIKGYIKDKSGASVPKAEVELTSEALIVAKKAVADNAGYFYFSV